MSTRFPPIAPEAMTADQARFADEVGNAKSGPYFAYQRSPGLWRAMQGVRQHLRGQGNIPLADQELAILVVARHWRSGFAFESHARLARNASVDEAVIAAVGRGERPELTGPQAAIHDYCLALVSTGRVDNDAFARVKTHYGEQACVDLIGLVGFYTAVSMILNVDGQAPAEAPPF